MSNLGLSDVSGSAKPVSVAFEKRTCSQMEKKCSILEAAFKGLEGTGVLRGLESTRTNEIYGPCG